MKLWFNTILLAVVAGGMFLAGAKYAQRSAAPAQAAIAGRKILYYVDPMNPSHTTDKPGLAPCGMQMEPVYAEEAGLMTGPGGPVLPACALKISPEKQQLIGVQVAPAEQKPLHCVVHLLGKVVVDENRLYRINAALDGLITHVAPCVTGAQIKKNDILAAYYSPEVLRPAQALLFALNAKNRLHAMEAEMPAMTDSTNATTPYNRTNPYPQIASTSQASQYDVTFRQNIDILKTYGLGKSQLTEIMETRKLPEQIDLIAPCDGFLLSRNITSGQSIEKGMELFRLADLSQVWIQADLFESEAEYVQPGLAVRVTLPHRPRSFSAKVSQVLPQFDGVSRTLKVRLEAANPDFMLRPDMYVDVEMPVTGAVAVVVPAEAVLDTGLQQAVFVARGQGYFEPRRVTTGWRLGGQVEIRQGLAAGESVVIAGNFLLNSESRMKLAAADTQAIKVKDPVCGMMVEAQQAKAARRQSEHAGQPYYFCSAECQHKFLEHPSQYAPAKSPSIKLAAVDQASSLPVSPPSDLDRDMKPVLTGQISAPASSAAEPKLLSTVDTNAQPTHD